MGRDAQTSSFIKGSHIHRCRDGFVSEDAYKEAVLQYSI